MATGSVTRNTNWWGLSSTVGLFVLILCYGKGGAQTVAEQVLLWGSLILVHLFGIKAARRRFGGVYLIPLGVYWLLVLAGFLVDYLRRDS